MSRSSRRPLSIPVLDSLPGAVSGFLAVALPLSLIGLGSTGAVSMEGMVADAARHMLDSGELLVPRLYGEIFAYKPPMAYWLTALSLDWFGDSLWALRLPSAAAGLVMGLVAVFLVGRATRPLVGLVTAIGSITGILYLQKLRLAEYDALLASAVGVAVLCAMTELAVDRRPSAPIWLLGYLSLTVACLTKGVPALMAYVPGLLGAAWVTGRPRRLLSAQHLAAVAGFVALVGGFLLWSWIVAGGDAFAQPYAEASTRGFQWTPHAFAWTFAKPALVWLLFLPWSLLWFRSPFRRSGERDGVALRLHLGALSFLALGTLAFVAVPTLENRYFLPLAAPAALVAALALDGRRASGERSRAPALALLGAVLFAWSIETLMLRPHRAASRNLSAAAAHLGGSIPARTTVWVPGPAGEAGKHASLYYHLRRPVRTFGPRDALPDGAWVILARGTTRGCLVRIAEVRHARGPFALYRHARGVSCPRREGSSGRSHEPRDRLAN